MRALSARPSCRIGSESSIMTAWFGIPASLGLAISLGVGALALAAPPAAPQEMTEAQSRALGRALVLRNCGMCHAVGATGASRDPQAPPCRRLNERMKVEDLGEGLATGILTGHPAMPEFRFEPHEVVAIVRYLRSVQSHVH